MAAAARARASPGRDPGADLADALAATVTDAVALVEFEPGPRFRFLDVNDVVLRNSGWARDEVVGHYADELLAPGDLEVRSRLWEQALRFAAPVAYAEPMAVPVGRRALEVTATPVAGPSGQIRLLLVGRDVTELDSAREKAVLFEQRYEEMLGYSSDGFVLCDADGRITYASAGCEALLGVVPAELAAQRPMSSHVHPDDLAGVTAGWSSALAHPGRVEQFMVRLRHRDGTWRDFSMRVVSRIDTPAVGAVIVTFCDTTERREAERQAAASAQRLEEIFGGAAEAIVTVNDAQEVVAFNTAAEELFDYAADELNGAPLGVLLPERFRDAHSRHVERFGQGTTERRLMSERAELVGRRRDGTEFPVEITISKAAVSGETYFTAIVRDVTERNRAERMLHASEARLRALVEHSDELVALVDGDGRVQWMSPAVERLLGYPQQIPEGQELIVWDVGHPEDVESFQARFRAARGQPGVPHETRGRGRHADGSWRWFSITITDLSQDSALGAVVLNVHDITRLKALSEQEAALAHLGQRALTGISVGQLVTETVTAITQVLDVDLALHAQLGPDGDDLLVRMTGGPVALDGTFPAHAETHWSHALTRGVGVELPRPSERPAGTEPLRDLGLVNGITLGISAGDEPYGVLGAYSTTTRAFRDDEIDFLHGLANLMAASIERRRFEHDLEHQMLHDSLTGLPNRLLLTDRFEHAVARMDRRDGAVAVLLLDLDDFKVINDSLGHVAGDALLQGIATRLGAEIRPADTLARFGGDEFVVLVEADTDALEQATRLAERVLQALHPGFQVTPDHEVFVTASIGVAIAEARDARGAIALSEADLAMYRAKRRGGDTYVIFDEELRTRVQTRLDLALGLRHALDLEEFRLVYQPKFELATRRITGVEALLRWDHPHDGLLKPETFLATAEGTGLIVPIGEWVIAEVCAQAARWRDTLGAHAPERTWVNLAARQLLHPGLLESVQRSLDVTGLDPSALGFEVTESVFIDDLDAAAEILGQLRELGAHLCLDDFGTGYSSLTYLRQLPFNCLKIDKSFIDELDEQHADDQDTTGIIAAIIDMAHDLGLLVTAEGIETAAQADTLAFLGCDGAQGYYFAQALPPNELAPLLTRNPSS